VRVVVESRERKREKKKRGNESVKISRDTELRNGVSFSVFPLFTFWARRLGRRGRGGLCRAGAVDERKRRRRERKKKVREGVEKQASERRRRCSILGQLLKERESVRETEREKTPYRLLRACSFSLASSLRCSGPCV
jgi:hypothetical protein